MEKVSHPWRNSLIVIFSTWLFTWALMESSGPLLWAEAIGMAAGPIALGILVAWLTRSSERALLFALGASIGTSALLLYGGTIS